MRKLGGYSLYFNKKYNRVGPLLQGRFKAVRVSTDAQLMAVTSYIHLNCLELKEPEWEERIFDPKEAIKFLESYRWSSYLDYIGKKNYPSVISKEFLKQVIGESNTFRKMTEEKIYDRAEMNKLFEKTGDLILE